MLSRSSSRSQPLPEKISLLLQEARWLILGVVSLYVGMILVGYSESDPRLRGAGLRYTRSRRRVVEVLAGTDRPLTIPDILARAGTLAQSSVYRNLNELIDAGVVHRIVAGDEFSHFELAEELTSMVPEWNCCSGSSPCLLV